MRRAIRGFQRRAGNGQERFRDVFGVVRSFLAGGIRIMEVYMAPFGKHGSGTWPLWKTSMFLFSNQLPISTNIYYSNHFRDDFNVCGGVLPK